MALRHFSFCLAARCLGRRVLIATEKSAPAALLDELADRVAAACQRRAAVVMRRLSWDYEQVPQPMIAGSRLLARHPNASFFARHCEYTQQRHECNCITAITELIEGSCIHRLEAAPWLLRRACRGITLSLLRCRKRSEGSPTIWEERKDSRKCYDRQTQIGHSHDHPR
jgi:hypothetical protein